MTQYQIGDRVKIVPEAATPFSGLEGVIQKVKPNDRNIRILDSYTVLFKWGERHNFYEAQLAPVDLAPENKGNSRNGEFQH